MRFLGGSFLRKLLIMIPGIMGSNLVYGSYRVWPRYFPENKDAYEKYLPLGKAQIYPAGIVEWVYKKMYNFLNEIEDIEVKPFPYDWRMDNLITVDKLDEFIVDNHKEYDEISIVAHSMGGLISKLLLNKYNEREYIVKIKNLITLGTPWHGSLDAYRTIVYGKSVPDKFPFHSFVLTKRKSKLLSKGFPSVYQLFPDQEYQNRVQSKYNLCILSKNDEDIDHMGIFEQEEIKKHMDELGFNYTTLIGEFRDILHSSNSNISHIVHHEIIGFGHTTLTSIKKNKRDEVIGYFENGDGTVPILSAKSDFAKERYFIKGAEHQNLVKDDAVLNVIKRILLNETIQETDRVFLDEKKVESVGFKSKVIRIACPVDVSILKDGKSIYGYGDSLGYDSDIIEEMIETNINVISLGNTVYLILNDDNESIADEQIIIEAYDEGPTSITVEQYSNGVKSKTATFKTFNINPSIVAQINLNDDVEQIKLQIRDKEQLVSTEDPINVNEKEIELPKTNVTFSADNEFVTEGIRIYAGEFKVSVDVNKGTYDVDKTYIKVNGKTIPLETDVDYSLISLEEGYHKIKVFSVDILGNEEIAEEFNIFYLKNFKPKIHFEILPHQYKIDVQDNNHILELCYKYELPRTTVRFVIDDEENVFIVDNRVTVLTQNPKIREINIIYETFLGEVDETVILDEFNILNFFEGIYNSNNFQDLLNNLNLDNPKEIKLTKIEGVGTYRKITDKNLNNSKKIYIANENKVLEIIKKSDYILSFHNLNEDIKIGDDEVYNFSFKVFDKDNNEIRTLELDAFLKISINNEDFITNEGDIVINFNEELDIYEGSFRIEIIERILAEYWESTPIHSAELVITKRGVTTNVIRTKEIKVRRND
jgi:pimeloyl-ACP methyl ester carboxylesterase